MVAQSSAFSNSDSGSPIKESRTYLTSPIPVLAPLFRERSYALGWIRTQLVGVTRVMGHNMRLYELNEMPAMGKGSVSRLAMYHQGATVGFFPSV